MLPTVALEREKYKLLTDVPGRVDYFFRDVVYQPEAVEKVLRKEGVDGILGGLAGILEASAAFDAKTLEERIRGFCSEKGLKPNKVFHPIRVAVSGRTDGATLFGMLELLGREKVLARIRTARQLLKP